MNVVAERFIELSLLQRKRTLNDSELRELHESTLYLENLEWEKAKLKNLSLMASMTDDMTWQQEICSQIDNLQN